MLNVHELEKRWLHYKVKSYIPYLVIVLSLVTIIVISFIILNNKPIESNKIDTTTQVISESNLSNTTIKNTPEDQSKTVEKNISIPKKNITLPVVEDNKPVSNRIEMETIPTSQYTVKPKQQDKIKLSPSMDFIKKFEENSLPYYKDEHEFSESSSNLQQSTNSQKEKPSLVLEKKPLDESKSSMSIKRQNTHEDIEHVIKRFKKNNNPALSLFVAKKYYELGDYHKAYNYALMTNELNSNIDASWIIFAKSLVKLNEKDMAIKTLKKYIDHSNSNKAKILLDEIISGKFQ